MTSKTGISDLAVFGGRPEFTQPLVFGRPNLPAVSDLSSSLKRTISNGWLSNNGPRVREFEEKIAELTNTRHCIATDNGTSALQITARALNMLGRVIVPSFTFIATPHAFAWQGGVPVFVDVDPATHCIDPQAVLDAWQHDITGICGVHLWGNLCDVDALTEIAATKNVPLIFDGAHALTCEDSRGLKVGGFGEAEVFSFHATKFINSSEGGAVTTNNPDLARELRTTRNFSFDESGNAQQIGTNAKMSEVAATIGLHSLSHLSEITRANRSNLERYKANLIGANNLSIASPYQQEFNNCQYVVLKVANEENSMSRETLLRCMRSEGIHAKAYFTPPCHLANAYRDSCSKTLPTTEKLSQQLMCLPTGLSVTHDEIDRTCELVRFINENGAHIEQKIRKMNGAGC